MITIQQCEAFSKLLEAHRANWRYTSLRRGSAKALVEAAMKLVADVHIPCDSELLGMVSNLDDALASSRVREPMRAYLESARDEAYVMLADSIAAPPDEDELATTDAAAYDAKCESRAAEQTETDAAPAVSMADAVVAALAGEAAE